MSELSCADVPARNYSLCGIVCSLFDKKMGG